MNSKMPLAAAGVAAIGALSGLSSIAVAGPIATLANLTAVRAYEITIATFGFGLLALAATKVRRRTA